MIEKIALKIAEWLIKVFTGKSSVQIEEESRRRNALIRAKEARQLCAMNGIAIQPETDIFDPAIRDEPAVQNYIHQVGLVHAVYDFPPQTSDPRYMLGYREGRQYE